jgi:iron(III) transport system substrate-binding protein
VIGRLAAACAALLTLAALLPACSGEKRPEVVLYTSCDDYLLRDIIPAFESETGIKVRLAGDTEATKTTGLVQRIIAERDQPRADVWWSNEPFGTMRLADEGLLAPFSPAATADFDGAWPEGFAAPDQTWYGFALRARVIVFNTQRIKREDAPLTLRELADPRWKGRIGMARPQFGTTRGHMGAIAARCGEETLRQWLSALKANGLRLYSGNSAVVRGVALGEIDIGLTDTDDVIVGQRENWPVDMVVEEPSPPGERCAVGPCPIPNTVSILKHAPNPAAAAKLADFLLSARVERILATSDSRNMPLRPGLLAEIRDTLPLTAVQPPDLPAIHRAIPRAMDICTQVLGD